MAKLLKGAEAVEAKCKELRKKVKRLNNEGTEPALAIIRVGSDPDNMAYERGIIKRAEQLGIKVEHYTMDEAVMLKDELLAGIDEDAECFEPLSKAYSLPSGTEEEKAEKEKIMEAALEKA